MFIFKFSSKGNSLGSRAQGKKIRDQIISNFSNSEKVALDFEGVDIISNSFADELLGKMIDEFGLTDVKKHTTFINTNRHIVTVLKKVINDRTYNMNVG